MGSCLEVNPFPLTIPTQLTPTPVRNGHHATTTANNNNDNHNHNNNIKNKSVLPSFPSDSSHDQQSLRARKYHLSALRVPQKNRQRSNNVTMLKKVMWRKTTPRPPVVMKRFDTLTEESCQANNTREGESREESTKTDDNNIYLRVYNRYAELPSTILTAYKRKMCFGLSSND